MGFLLENVPESDIGDDAQLCDYTKNHCFIYFKLVIFMAYEFYLNLKKNTTF